MGLLHLPSLVLCCCLRSSSPVVALRFISRRSLKSVRGWLTFDKGQPGYLDIFVCHAFVSQELKEAREHDERRCAHKSSHRQRIFSF